MQQSIDISFHSGPQQQTRRSGVRRPIDETDGRTLDRYINHCSCEQCQLTTVHIFENHIYLHSQIGFTFLVPAHLGSPGKRAVKRVCVCVCCLFIWCGFLDERSL